MLVDRFAKGAAVKLVMSQAGHFVSRNNVAALTMLPGLPATDSRAGEHPKGAPQRFHLDQMLGHETSLMPDSPRISAMNSFGLDATSLTLRRSGAC